MTQAELDAIGDQLSRIWAEEGLNVELASSLPLPSGPRLLLIEDPIQVSAAGPNLCSLGAVRFVNGTPQPELTVSVGAARAFVRQARPDWPVAVRLLAAARIVGRVAAHELGHFLLAEPGHRLRGLMRARFDGAELLGLHLQPFRPPPRADLEARLISALGDAVP